MDRNPCFKPCGWSSLIVAPDMFVDALGPRSAHCLRGLPCTHRLRRILLYKKRRHTLPAAANVLPESILLGIMQYRM